MTQLSTQATLADLAATHPQSLKVFHKNGLDFCCGGRRTLADACDAAGLSADEVLARIAELERTPDEVRWDTAPLGELIDHIIERHHRPLDEELPRLEAMARRVLNVHGGRNPGRFEALLQAFLDLRDDLGPHMNKEEVVLFPWIRSGRASEAQAPVKVMLYEHDQVAEILRRLRALTDDYVAPPDACGTWRALWHGLHELEADLHEHIHLENNILFTRALQGA